MKKGMYLILAVWVLGLWACQPKAEPETQAATVFASGEEMAQDAMKRIVQVSPQQADSLMAKTENYVLLDVRQESEASAKRIPGSVNMPRGVLEFRINRPEVWEKEGLYMPEKDNLIIVYCKKGDRAALATETLLKMGFTNVRSLAGGIQAWETVFADKVEQAPAAVEEDKPAPDATHVSSDSGGGGC